MIVFSKLILSHKIGKLDRGKKSELPPQLTELTFLSALPSNNNPHTHQWFFSEQKNCYQKLFVKHAYDHLLKEEKNIMPNYKKRVVPQLCHESSTPTSQELNSPILQSLSVSQLSSANWI